MNVRIFLASVCVCFALAVMGWSTEEPDSPADTSVPQTDASPGPQADESASPTETKPAADTPTPETEEASKPAVDPAVKAAAQTEFTEILTEWKGIISQLANLQIKYRTANDEKQTEIQQQWKDLMATGEQLEGSLIDAAEKAYAVAPNEDKVLTEFLANLVGTKMAHDDFEAAARIGKLLMDNHCDDKYLPVSAGIAAIAVADFDSAAKYLKIAVDKKVSLASGCDYVDGLTKAFLKAPKYFRQTWAKEKQIRELEADADNLPRVLLKTTKGDIELELFENEAPLTVANFIYLVKKKYYDGLTFHRVLRGFMAQSGDPKGDGSGGPGYRIACECYKPDFRPHFRGSLSMAKADSGGSDGYGRDTGGSQFFITFVPTVTLNGVHTVFGRVVSGMDVLARLQRRDPTDKEAPRADKIIEAKVLRDRMHEYVPKKLLD